MPIDWAAAMRRGDSLRPIPRERFKECTAGVAVLMGADKPDIRPPYSVPPSDGTFVVVLTD